jgi:hypothetical protein
MKSVLGIDLGASWQTTGSAVLSFEKRDWVACTPGAIVWPESACTPALFAATIIRFALENNIGAISLDGPQGWRDPEVSGNFVGRDCERLARTPGKTGTFGNSKPGSWLAWIQFSILAYERLLATPNAVLVNNPDDPCLLPLPDRKFYVLECFPTSTWRRAGLKSLPGHNIDLATMQAFARELQATFCLPDVVPTGAHGNAEHDNLQAIVAALPAAALLGGPCRAYPCGVPSRVLPAMDSVPMHRVEGIIWDAEPMSAATCRATRNKAESIRSVLSSKATAKELSTTIPMLARPGVEVRVRLFEDGELPECDFVYFATPSCGSFTITAEFVDSAGAIIAHAYNNVGLRMPLIQHLRPGHRILLVYGSDGMYSPVFSCRVCASLEPVRTSRHTFDALCYLADPFHERLRAEGYAPDPVIQRFIGISIDSLQDLRDNKCKINKPKGNNTLRRWDEVFPHNDGP